MTTKAYLSLDEVAELSPYSVRTIRRAISSGELRYTQRGKGCRLMVKPEWLDEWLAKRMVEPTR